MTIAEQITERFPVRKSRAQKKAFRQWVMAQMSSMGYPVRVEQNDKGRHQNIVAGCDPDYAQAVISAHYDTPATILLPDLQIPRNFPVYVAYQAAVIGGMLLLSLLAGAGFGLLTQDGSVMLLAFFGMFVALMALQLYGVPNPNNANDNTSGVAALLETMARIPADKRDRVAFLLFDNMESGRRGSKAYARDHIESQHTRFLVNLDSVGVGEHLLASASSLAQAMPQYDLLERCLSAQEERPVRFFSSATTRGNSDFRSFKCGVGITACERIPGVGYFLGRLHTPWDTELDEGNITCLADALAEYVQQL